MLALVLVVVNKYKIINEIYFYLIRINKKV